MSAVGSSTEPQRATSSRTVDCDRQSDSIDVMSLPIGPTAAPRELADVGLFTIDVRRRTLEVDTDTFRAGHAQ